MRRYKPESDWLGVALPSRSPIANPALHRIPRHYLSAAHGFILPESGPFAGPTLAHAAESADESWVSWGNLPYRRECTPNSQRWACRPECTNARWSRPATAGFTRAGNLPPGGMRCLRKSLFSASIQHPILAPLGSTDEERYRGGECRQTRMTAATPTGPQSN